MHGVSIRATVVALVCAVTLLAGTAGSAVAQQNDQSGLINVNLQNLNLQVPISVALPISLAANVCGLDVLAIREGSLTECDAQSSSDAMSRAVARALFEQGA